MSFADDVRKNFVSKPEIKPPRHSQNLARSVARSCIEKVKPLLMQEARNGNATCSGISALGLTKKTVKVNINVNVDKHRYPCVTNTTNNEGEYCGPGVPDTLALHQLLSELRTQCSAEGIHVSLIKGMYNNYYFVFSVNV